MIETIRLSLDNVKANEIGEKKIGDLIDLGIAATAVLADELADETGREDDEILEEIERNVTEVADKALSRLGEIADGNGLEYLVYLFTFAASVAATAVVEYQLVEFRAGIDGGGEQS